VGLSMQPILSPEPDSFCGTVHISKSEERPHRIHIPGHGWRDEPAIAILCFFIAQKPIGIIFSWDGEKDNELSYIMANAHNLKFEELYKEHSSVLELKKDVHLNSVTAKLTEGMTDTAPRFHIDIRPDSSSDLCNIM
jgi:hypothetical protein